MQEDQGGPIADRSLEHLVSADQAIIQVRQRLLKALRGLQEGIEPMEPVAASENRVRPIDIVLAHDVDVWDGAADYLAARAW